MYPEKNNEDIFKGLGVEVKLPDDDAFLKIMETLTRIGIPSEKDGQKRLFQSCHILHKRGRYAIMHFKELFVMDGKGSDFSEEDLARRNTIATLLSEWGLIKLVTPEQVKEPVLGLNRVRVLAFKEKTDWVLLPKYRIGASRKDERGL